MPNDQRMTNDQKVGWSPFIGPWGLGIPWALGIGIWAFLSTTSGSSQGFERSDKPQEATPPKGPPIHSIVFEGRNWVPEEKLLEVSGLRPGLPWAPRTEEEALRRLAAWPYLLTVAPPKVTRQPDGSVDVVFPIHEALLIGSVQFEGNDTFRSQDLLAETGLRSGQPLHEMALREAE